MQQLPRLLQGNMTIQKAQRNSTVLSNCVNGCIRIRYDTRCYINVRPKANMSQLNLYRTQPTTKKCKNRKTTSRKQICSEITVNSAGNLCSENLRRRNEGMKGYSGKDLRKRKVLSLEWKSEWLCLELWGAALGAVWTLPTPLLRHCSQQLSSVRRLWTLLYGENEPSMIFFSRYETRSPMFT